MTEISERTDQDIARDIASAYCVSRARGAMAFRAEIQAVLDAEAREIKLKLRNLRTAASRALEALESEDHEMCAEAWHELANQFDGVTEDDYTPWDKRNSIYCGTRLVGGWCKRAPLHEGDHACS